MTTRHRHAVFDESKGYTPRPPDFMPWEKPPKYDTKVTEKTEKEEKDVSIKSNGNQYKFERVAQIIDFFEPAKLLLEDCFLVTCPFKFSLLSNTVDVVCTALEHINGAVQMTYFKDGSVSFDHNLQFTIKFDMKINVTTNTTEKRTIGQRTETVIVKGLIHINDLRSLNEIDLSVVFPPQFYTSNPKSPLAGFVGSQCRAALKSHKSIECIKKSIATFEEKCVTLLKKKLLVRRMGQTRRGATSNQGRRQSTVGVMPGVGVGGADFGRRQSTLGQNMSGSSLLAGVASTIADSEGVVTEDSVVVGGVVTRSKDIGRNDLAMQILTAHAKSAKDVDTIIKDSKKVNEHISNRRISTAFAGGGSSIMLAIPTMTYDPTPATPTPTTAASKTTSNTIAATNKATSALTSSMNAIAEDQEEEDSDSTSSSSDGDD